jgi:hypothetical protein
VLLGPGFEKARVRSRVRITAKDLDLEREMPDIRRRFIRRSQIVAKPDRSGAGASCHTAFSSICKGIPGDQFRRGIAGTAQATSASGIR